jgi:hypothetical protein
MSYHLYRHFPADGTLLYVRHELRENAELSCCTTRDALALLIGPRLSSPATI